jgi:hypothetical protein
VRRSLARIGIGPVLPVESAGGPGI